MKKEYTKPEVKKLEGVNLVKYIEDPKFYDLFRKYSISHEEQEEQRRSFAYGNIAMKNPDITRELIDEAAELLKQGDYKCQH